MRQVILRIDDDTLKQIDHHVAELRTNRNQFIIQTLREKMTGITYRMVRESATEYTAKK